MALTLVNYRLIPKILAGLAFVVGLVNVLTGALLILSLQDTDVFYNQWLQLVQVERGSNMLAILVGIVLVALGRGLWQQRRATWRWTVFFLLVSLVNSFLPPVTWHTAILSLAYLLLLVVYRRQFYRRTMDSMHYQKTIAWLSVLFALSYGVIGSYLLRTQFNNIHNWVDALYYTLETYSTVGYGDIVPVTSNAKIFTISMIIIGVVSFLTALSVLLGPVIQRNIKGVYKMVSTITRLDEHILLCGDNLLTREVAQTLLSQGKQCFFLEPTLALAATLEADGFTVVHVNPANEDDLRKVNAHRAAYLLSAYEDDARNILVMMAASQVREGHPGTKLELIARIEALHNIDKAKRAGATQVISPLKISADIVIKGFQLS